MNVGLSREVTQCERKNPSGHQTPTISQPDDTANKTDPKQMASLNKHNSQTFESPPRLCKQL